MDNPTFEIDKTKFSNLKGKTLVITGATTGIGFETAKLFVEHGANVVVG